MLTVWRRSAAARWPPFSALQKNGRYGKHKSGRRTKPGLINSLLAPALRPDRPWQAFFSWKKSSKITLLKVPPPPPRPNVNSRRCRSEWRRFCHRFRRFCFCLRLCVWANSKKFFAPRKGKRGRNLLTSLCRAHGWCVSRRKNCYHPSTLCFCSSLRAIINDKCRHLSSWEFRRIFREQ